MKNFTIIATIIVLLASCSEEQRAIDRFKKKLNDPSSFEFVDWEYKGEYAEVFPHYLDFYRAKCHEIESKTDKELCDYDTLFLYREIANVRLKSYENIIRQYRYEDEVYANFKKYKKTHLWEVYDNMVDTMRMDTISLHKIFKYRANNEYGAKTLYEGEIETKYDSDVSSKFYSNF